MRRHVVIILWCAAVMWWGSAPPARAYLDPATTSYLIQIVSAVIISMSVAIGLFFTRLQTFVITARPRIGAWWARVTRGTPGGAASGVRSASGARSRATGATRAASPAPILDPALQAAVDAALSGAVVTASTPSRRAKLFGDDRRWLQRLPLAVLAVAGVSVPLLAAGPIELYVVNWAELPFKLSTLVASGIVSAVLVAGVLGLLLSLVRGRVFDVVVSLFVGWAVASWVQVMFLNLDTGNFTGAQFPWNKYLGLTLLDVLIWGLLIALPLVVRVLNRKVWRATVIIVPAILMLVSAISASASTGGIRPNGWGQMPGTGRYLSFDGIDQVSSTKNIIVFLVDATDEQVIQDLMHTPDFSFGPLTGFTSFDQNVARYQETFPALPYMFTGDDYLWDQPRSTFFQQAYSGSDFLPELKRLGYRINLYTMQEDLYWVPDNLAGLVDNLSPAAPNINYPSLMSNMARLSAYGRSPTSLQPALGLDPDAFSNVLEGSTGQAAPYKIDDVVLYQRMLAHPLKVRDATPQFSFIHMFAAHQPFTMNANAERVEATTRTQQAIGSFKIIYTYLAQLRLLGLYNSSTIIIMADHGTHLPWEQRQLNSPLLPSLLIKPADAPGGPLQHSDAPTYMDNFQATIIQAAGGDPAPFGQTYFQVSVDAVRTRRFYWIRPAIDDYKGELQVYDITGDARIFSSWHLVGKLPMNDGYIR